MHFLVSHSIHSHYCILFKHLISITFNFFLTATPTIIVTSKISNIMITFVVIIMITMIILIRIIVTRVEYKIQLTSATSADICDAFLTLTFDLDL